MTNGFAPEHRHSPSGPLKVLQVNSLFNSGGADSQTLELARGLQELGAEAHLAIATESRWRSRAEVAGVPTHTFPRKSPLKSGMILKIASVIRRGGINVVHAHQGRDYWPIILAARIAGSRVLPVVTRHLMTQPRAFSRMLLLRGAAVIAVSQAVERVLKSSLRGPADRIYLAYNGIDVTEFGPERSIRSREWRSQLGWKEDHVAFGVVGAFDLPRGKGQLEFAEAAARIISRHPQARFVVVGGGSMEGLLRQRVLELGIKDVFAFVPFTDENAAVMGALDVLVHPAVGTDAFPLVVLEGMASGKPVIASRIDGIPEQFRHQEQGFLVPPGDVDALVSAMQNLLVAPELRLQMRSAGRQRVLANFTRAHLAERVRTVYVRELARP